MRISDWSSDVCSSDLHCRCHDSRGSTMVRRLRLISGLVLFTYVLTHLLNLVLGLVSLPALEAGREVFLAAWRPLPVTVLLYGSLLVHLALAYYAIFRRDSLAMPLLEALRYPRSEEHTSELQ